MNKNGSWKKSADNFGAIGKLLFFLPSSEPYFPVLFGMGLIGLLRFFQSNPLTAATIIATKTGKLISP